MKLKTLFVLIAGISGISAMQVFSAEQDNQAYREGYNLVLEQRWEEAQAYFSRFPTEWPDSAWTDDAAFWNCYAAEQRDVQQDQPFSCYQNFIQTWPQSTWVSDARSKLAVLGDRLASRGNPEYTNGLRDSYNQDFDFDFEFEFDSDDIEESVRSAMATAEREMERVREMRIEIPELPEFPEVPELPARPDVASQQDWAEYRDRVNRYRERVQRSVQAQRERNQGARNSADDELLAIISSLRDDTRASEILLQRLQESDNPELRSRIVLLLEDMSGDNVTEALMEIVRTDESERVRNDAVVVLVDRRRSNDERVRDFLTEVSRDNNYSPAIRAEIIGRMDNWYGDAAIVPLAGILANETNIQVVEEAADALSDIGSESALEALTNSYRNLEDEQLKAIVLEEIAGVELDSTISWLSDVAIQDTSDLLAAIAIEGIADRETNIAVAALDHVFNNTQSPQRQLAAIHGIGESATLQSVELLQNMTQSTDDLILLREIVGALGDTNQEAAVPVLAAIYQSQTDAVIRTATIRALRQLNEYDLAVETMLEILEERIAAEATQQ